MDFRGKRDNSGRTIHQSHGKWKHARRPCPLYRGPGRCIWEQFYLDQEINDRGIRVDMELVDAALTLDAQAKATLSAEMHKLTGIENPNSVYQLLEWLAEHGYQSDCLNKSAVRELLKAAKEPVKSVLELRLMLSKSSVRKYQAMQTAACSDHRARGMFSFYGASRTGRWAGRIIQLQNLPQNHIPDLTDARETVKHGYYDEVEMFYEDVPDTLSQLIRTAFVPRPGYKFIVADFSAIEARVIAWLAGEQWRMDAFANGEDIYCASASKMFGVPVVKHGENGHLRQKGKVAELACGYGGSVGAMKAMGGDVLNLSDAELKQIVTDWRNASPHIVKFWWAVDDAIKTAIRRKTATETHGLRFSCQSGMLFITLPSGRKLCYAHPQIGENRFGGESVTYERDTIMQRFDCREIKTDADIADWNAGKIPVALIQPSSAGHGLNLQSGGSTIIWYTMPWSLELYQQTNARLWRQGQQSRTVVIHHLVSAGTIDEDIMKVLKMKDKTQAAMMRAVKAREKA